MKIAAPCCLVSVVAVATAFQQRPAFSVVAGRRSAAAAAAAADVRLFAAEQNRPDASSAIKEAMKASEKYGPTSPEARVAWDAVEEMDASDNHAAYEATGERLSDDQLVKMTSEFKANLETVKRLSKDFKIQKQHMEDVAAEMATIKLAPPEKRPAPKSPAVEKALAEAKAASEKYGPTSPEARVAWTELEEIASSGLENAMGGDLTEECLVSSAEACIALEELDRFVNLEKMKESGLSNF